MYRYLSFSILSFVLSSSHFVTANHEASAWSKHASVQWSGTQLRDSLKRFADAQHIHFFLDRRIDPDHPLEYQSTDRDLASILSGLADSLHLGCHFFDTVVYIGPKESAAALKRAVEGHRSARPFSVFRRKTSLEIPFLGEPKKLLDDLATKNKFRWQNLDTLPHDLWNENVLPEMPLGELLSLLLAGFDMDYSIAGSSPAPELQLVCLSKTAYATAEHPVKIDTKTRVAENTAEPLQEIPLERRRFTIHVEDQRLDAVLAMLCIRLGLELDLDEKSLAAKGVSTEARVSFDVKNATAVELFRAVLKPLKLEFRLQNKAVRIR